MSNISYEAVLIDFAESNGYQIDISIQNHKRDTQIVRVALVTPGMATRPETPRKEWLIAHGISIEQCARKIVVHRLGDVFKKALKPKHNTINFNVKASNVAEVIEKTIKEMHKL